MSDCKSRSARSRTHILSVVDELIRQQGRDVLSTSNVVPFFSFQSEPTWFSRYGSDLGLVLYRPVAKHLKGRKAKKAFRSGFNVRSKAPSFLEALYLARATMEVLFDYDQTLRNFPVDCYLYFITVTSRWPSSAFVKNAKFFTAWPMARFLRNDLPLKPPTYGSDIHPLIFRGALKRYLKSRLVADNNKNARLFIGLLQGVKRGCAAVNPSYVEAAMHKHRETLTKEPHEHWDEYDVVDEIRPYVLKILKDLHISKPRLLEPSQSASFNTKRSTGGAREYIRSIVGHHYGHDELISMELERGQGAHRVHEIRGVPEPDIAFVLSMCTNERTPVMVQAILEPLKVRLITKGSEFSYWLSRYLQRTIHSHLRELDPFRLIGEPLTEVHLEGMMEKSDRLTTKIGVPFDRFVSGDYSAATDNLKITVTQTIFEEIIQRFPDLEIQIPDVSGRCVGELREGCTALKDVLRTVIYEQDLHYPEKYGIEPATQRNGQLMGSTLSFPILCIANIAVYWMTLDKYLASIGKKPVDALTDLPVLVNGDDIQFPANEAFYDFWKADVPRVGFELSLGKNYIHENLLTANSQYYRHQVVSGLHQFHELHYLNTGLLIGQAKITGRKTAKEAPLWDLYNTTIPRACDPERAHRRFMHYHLDQIKKMTAEGKFNIFADHLCGGLGFKPPATVDPGFTPFQRKWATYLKQKILDDMENGLPPRSCKITLVREKRGKESCTTHHKKTYIVPKYGPHFRGTIPPVDGLHRYRPLCRVGDDNEENTMVVRFPKSKFFREFEQGGWSKTSTLDMLEFPYKLASFDPDEALGDHLDLSRRGPLVVQTHLKAKSTVTV